MSRGLGILKWRGALPILATALVASVGLGALGQDSLVAQGALHDSDYPPPYDHSKADLALKAYDASHPNCGLWSDWHKLCSRTGPNGSTYCRTDPEHPTKPSTPFCGRYLMSENTAMQTMPTKELRSRQRFSSIHPEIKTSTQFKSREVVYSFNRPFNGRSISELSHPACAAWFDKGAENCSGNVNKNSLYCNKYIEYKRFICIKWKNVSNCSDLKTGGIMEIPDMDEYDRFKDAGALKRSKSAGDYMYMGPSYRLNLSPVWGVYCGY